MKLYNLESIKWDLVPLEKIIQSPILNNQQRVEFLKNQLEVNQTNIKINSSSQGLKFSIPNFIQPKMKEKNREILLNKVVTIIGHLYNEQKYTDCEFLFLNEEETLKAHKLVLCFSSQVFEVIFYGYNGQKIPVEIKNTDKTTFELVLK